ncbi:MAG: hypothetical protein KAQ66_09980 [Rhodospirillaceae bacterium]|nr:hypothetical protein [Rhodospirillaceae bacterium]MCK5547163.1 hypothetical protein [Rhodospirillaceae bacterium]
MRYILTNYIFKTLASCILIINLSACSEDALAHPLEGTWLLDKSALDSNSKAYLKATRSAETLTFTPTSAISGNIVMDVSYEPADEGYMVLFEGMKEAVLYKLLDKDTFEIRVIDVGRFRYMRQQISEPKK